MQKLHPSLLLLLISLVGLAGCGQSSPTDFTPSKSDFTASVSSIASSSTPAPTVSVVVAPTESATAEAIVRPTFEEWPTVTLVPATPNQLPSATLDVTRLVTRTPSPPQGCPSRGTAEPPQWVPASENFNQDYEIATLTFLNTGGSAEALRVALQTVMEWFDAYSVDLTHDGVAEVVVIAKKPHIFGCQSGKYATLLVVEPVEYYTPQIIGTVDMNLNGMPELVIADSYGGMTPTNIFQILEWNGQRFQSLVAPEHLHSQFVDAGVFHGDIVMHGAVASIRDTDHNGTLELVLNGGIPVTGADMASFGPWRGETLIWAWNGNWFQLSSAQRDPPVYRFQAVQDGDRLTITGYYDDAIATYQKAIQDDALDWWSPERTEYEVAWFDAFATRLPMPTPDPAERPRLSAYATYRIMLIHAALGEASLASADYESIRTVYAAGEATRPYAELARAFWTAYQNTADVTMACGEAVAFAMQHSDSILDPLGADYYGGANMRYSAQDICPFGQQ
ncbi:MAG: hypothetical protein IT317_14750 [Anaerolineales bacterium]|nr:hypothetical protein [Anaerolineales bacterium]